jgi:phospholipid/cholesterol/gamma-HCH transport system permease protein
VAVQWREFIQQCWFISKVSVLPLMLISVPFGMIIALHVRTSFRQLGAESQSGSALLLAVVREQAPIATALMISGVGGSAMCTDLGSWATAPRRQASPRRRVSPLRQPSPHPAEVPTP